MESPKLLLVDEPGIFRDCLRSAVDATGRFTVVATAASEDEATRLTVEASPQIVLSEFATSKIRGLRLLTRLQDLGSPPRVAFLSSYDVRFGVINALKAGASAYVHKSSPLETLLAALDAGSPTNPYIDGTVAGQWAMQLVSGVRGPVTSERLTPREHDVLQQIAHGRSTKEAAEELCVSPKTVESHRQSIMRKLGIRKATLLVGFAYRNGLVHA